MDLEWGQWWGAVMGYLVFLFCFLVAWESWGSTLFFLEEVSDKKCVAKTMDFPSGNEKVLFSTSQCPSQIVWAKTRDRVYFTSNSKLWEQTLDKKNGGPKVVASLPTENVSLWLDEPTDQLRIAYLKEVKPQDVITSEKGKEKNIFFRFEGKMYPAKDLEDWGLPYMAVAAELKDKKWVRLEVKATKSEAGDNLSIFILDTFVNKKSSNMNLESMLKKTTCRGDLECSIKNSSIKKLIGPSEDGYGYLETGAKNRFVFMTMFGDSPHAHTPVYFCPGPCAKGFKLKTSHDGQLSLSADLDHVFIATEYDNKKPYIFSAKTGKLIKNLPKARAAVWLPLNQNK